ncbi:hypothetical protein MUK71_01290 [Arthrobacter zhangbolii]|uniref:Uncharacterized protein n=1 Tax=Arthrobacter zhangbolii TaxID=2886936 RepID=A0A9X1S9U9_9MICC|nr:hypothetical protein [Arthrobacter zhangbolii]MCC3273508.1 hypothetical protein [Arthrobacter zhangbolii]UON92321.1 hypothetical protein MUK71_01290 [Arthrobacter zhangbolii]
MINADAPLPEDLFAAFPGEDAVMGHEIAVNCDRWQDALSTRGLPPLQGVLAGPGITKVSRADVFELGGREITPSNAFQLLYYSLAWGLGRRAPRLHQRLNALAAHQDRAEELLVEAWQGVRSGESAQDVYGVLTTDKGKGRIPWFGPAFSTKFLYFAQGQEAPPRYLILDQVVARNLSDVWPGAPTAAWFPDTYARYCAVTGSWAEQATERLDGARKVRADEIEFVLFKRR